MSRVISLVEIRKRAAKFVSDWAGETGEEKQQGHEFMRELLKVYGIEKRKAAMYERRAQRSTTGGTGYIDGLVPGLCAIEMKSAGADLALAEEQALDYLDSLPDAEMPRYVLSSDFHNFRLLDLEGETGTETTTFPLSDLPEMSRELAFFAGYQNRKFGSVQQEEASIKAAKIMASIYESLASSGISDHVASVFMVRTLFCLYGDDSGLWGERDQFWEYIETRTSEDGSDLGMHLAVLYQNLNKKPGQRQLNTDPLIMAFPYVNGGLFAETVEIPYFDSAMRDRLLEACAFNWASISPAIFGSLFQAVKSKEARRELGEHYTTETNILKTIGPLFMDELHDRYAQSSHSVASLKKLRRDLAALRILDPACGCGNFLIIAYRELRALELSILLRLQALGDTSQIPTLFFTKEDLAVTLDHVVGIELEEWPARIAETALHLAEHQANQAQEVALGMAPDPFPLDKVSTIHVSNSLATHWGEVLTPTPNVRIVGNPPFVGQSSKTDQQTADMKLVWGKQYDGYLDYVTAWIRKSADYFANTPGGRFAFVSTNSIAQGQPVPALFRPILDAGWRIRFAHQTFAWSSEAPGAAAVHCVITGYDKNEKRAPILFRYRDIKGSPTAVPVKTINPYLVDGPVVYVEKRMKPLSRGLPEVKYGSKPTDGGHLLVGKNEYENVMEDPIAAKYLRKFIGAKELIHGANRWCLWLEDLDPVEYAASPVLKARIEGCKEFRLESKKAATRTLADYPHLFGERRQPKVPYLALPAHFSENRRYFTAQRFGPEVVCGNANFTAEDPDGFLFAIISSSMFLAWQASTGGRIKSDYRFANTIVWNNLPLPAVSDTDRASIVASGQAVLEARAKTPDRSLHDHYGPIMDPDLLRAHRALDRLVDKAFGAKKAETMEDRQSVLFAHYVETTGEGA